MRQRLSEVRMTGRRDRIVMWGFAAAAMLLGVLAWYRTSEVGRIVPANERKAMPELVLAQSGGGDWRLADHRGQVVLVNYWATWCLPCREEMPGLSRLARELGPQGLAVVGVSIDKGSRARVGELVEKMKVPYPVAFPDPLSQMEWGMAGVPTTILVDRQGRVAKSYVGAMREGVFRSDVEKLLAEK